MTASLKYEIIRKIIHIFTALIPFFYYFYWTKEQTILIALILFVFFLIAEAGRRYVTVLQQIFEKIFSNLLRNDEINDRLTGATLLFGGLTISAVLFEKDIAIVAMLNLSVSDALAALGGKVFGKRKIGNKTLEGSIIFFLAAILWGWLLINNLAAILIMAVFVTLVELYVSVISDNLSVPVTSGFILTLVLYYF